MQYLRTHQLAKLTGLSSRYFEKARLTGDGPPYIKVGRSIIYDLERVRHWLELGERLSTSDPGPKTS